MRKIDASPLKHLTIRQDPAFPPAALWPLPLVGDELPDLFLGGQVSANSLLEPQEETSNPRDFCKHDSRTAIERQSLAGMADDNVATGRVIAS